MIDHPSLPKAFLIRILKFPLPGKPLIPGQGRIVDHPTWWDFFCWIRENIHGPEALLLRNGGQSNTWGSAGDENVDKWQMPACSDDDNRPHCPAPWKFIGPFKHWYILGNMWRRFWIDLRSPMLKFSFYYLVRGKQLSSVLEKFNLLHNWVCGQRSCTLYRINKWSEHWRRSRNQLGKKTNIQISGHSIALKWAPRIRWTWWEMNVKK